MAFRQLVHSLDQLQLMYESLYEVGLAKKESVIHNRLDELTVSLAKESKLLKQIADCEKARVDAVVALQKHMGVRPNPYVTLAQVSKMLFHAEEKKELADTQLKLANTVKSLKQLNELNQQLIQQSIALVEYSLDLLVGPPEDEVVYHNPNLAYTGPKRNGFDTRA